MTSSRFGDYSIAAEFSEEKPVKLTPTSVEEIRAKKGRPSPEAGADGKVAGEPIAQLTERVSRLEAELGQGEVTRQDLEEVMEQIRDLSAKLDGIMSSLRGTVGFGARHSFVCRSCQAKGQVAARLHCTSCGEENWWGWWPQQK